ncbi:MAG: hypothetical protein ABSE50_23440 [Xanthobacteraceae bacterium]|jgi:hypothetical protein
MTSDGQPVERLREFLRTLKPEARSMLVQELERGILRGDSDPGNQFVLEELRRTVRAEARPIPRIGDAARLFFAPFEPFLFDGPADHKRIGRLARVSLDPIWHWIGRDLIPAEAKALGEDIDRALLVDDGSKADGLVRALHDRAQQKMRESLAAIGNDERAQRRFAIQVGTPRPMEDIATLCQIIEVRDVLADLAKRIPTSIRAFEREIVDQIKTLIDTVSSAKNLGAAAVRKNEVIRFGLILLMNRLAVPWQVIRLATRAAESDEPARIGETPYAVAVNLAIGEVEATIDDLRTEFKAGRPVMSMLKSIHDAARGLRTEIDLSGDSVWSRQVAAVRAEVSNLLKSEIDSTPGRVRRLLRPRPANEIAPRSTIDAGDLGEVEARVEFVSACRNYAGELALSEVTLRSYSELTQYLETSAKILLDTLRHAGNADRSFRQSQVDAAIRLCRTVFGNDYAATLAKAADVAAHAAITEKKPAAHA